MKNNILDYFEETVKKSGEKSAIIDSFGSITFNDLHAKSTTLSDIIVSKIYAFNKPIAVLLPKSINSVIADIAITYSSNIYMNIDVKSPKERIKNIFELIQPILVITTAEYLDSLNGLIDESEILNIDEVDFIEYSHKTSVKSRLLTQIDTDPLCIINTSGSTGTPKGVVLNHRSFIDFTEVSIEVFKFNFDEVIGSLSPLVFDIYSFELCLLMARGSTLCLIPENLSAFPVKILEIIKHNRVSFIFWVPTIMVNIANMNLLESVTLPDLRIVWFAGEVFPTKQFNYWKNMLRDTLFANLYGPIEITLDCTYFIVNRDIKDDEPIPIGIPYRNTDILILNDKDEMISDGEEGELCVRGTSLAMGYYNNPEKTASVFVQNPLNKSYPEIIYRTGDIVALNSFGEIVFKGRKDTLVKHLGYRIELGEIEHVIINILKIVKNGCVVYQFIRKEIILFYESEIDIAPVEFRSQISSILPKYMIPTKYIRLDEMPRNTNGKIDRLSLNNQINL